LDTGRVSLESFEPTGSPTERGPYNVGYRTFEVTYQAEGDGTEEPRTLEVSTWYPTPEEPEGRGPKYAEIKRREEVEERAKVANLESMPLLVFSHGNGGLAEQNYFQTEFFASHGWVVVSPDHTGNTFVAGADINYQAGVYRPQDITAVLDEATDWPDDHPLHGRLSGRIAMSGHSFGGYTTLANAGAEYSTEQLKKACEEETLARQSLCKIYTKPRAIRVFEEGFHDERIDVAIPQTPGGAAVFREGLEELEVPTLLMTGDMDQTLPNEREGDRIWQFMEGENHRRMNLLEGGHFTFSNMCNLLGTLDPVQQDGCGEAFIDVERAQRMINTYSLAFARAHLFEDVSAETRAIVDGDRFPHGEAGVEYRVGTE
jgi:predicted dienelactone hydrolase